MGEIRFVPATVEHAELLARTMRQDDVAEVHALGGEPRQMLLDGLARSAVVMSVFYGVELGAMCGVEVWPRGETLLGRTEIGAIWSLTSSTFGRYPVAFTKAARLAVDALLERWPLLCNLVDGRYAGAQRLIEHLGGEFGAPVMVGGQPFLPFRFRRSAWLD